jgi:hypothetical protein
VACSHLNPAVRTIERRASPEAISGQMSEIFTVSWQSNFFFSAFMQNPGNVFKVHDTILQMLGRSAALSGQANMERFRRAKSLEHWVRPAPKKQRREHAPKIKSCCFAPPNWGGKNVFRPT